MKFLPGEKGRDPKASEPPENPSAGILATLPPRIAKSRHRNTVRDWAILSGNSYIEPRRSRCEAGHAAFPYRPQPPRRFPSVLPCSSSILLSSFIPQQLVLLLARDWCLIAQSHTARTVATASEERCRPRRPCRKRRSFWVDQEIT